MTKRGERQRDNQQWVLENNFHNPRFMEHIGGMEFIGYLADWLKDALAGHKPANLKRERSIHTRKGRSRRLHRTGHGIVPARALR